MRIAIAASLVLFLAGCGVAPISTSETGNPNMQAELIAVVDGCNVWRLNDVRYVYLYRCPDGAGSSQYDYTVSNGKTTTRHTLQAVGHD
jgi:hypothetical protein